MNCRCLLLTGFFAFPIISPGSQSGTVFELPPYPVTTFLTEEGAFSRGQSISIFGKETFLRHLPRTFAESLRRTPGIMVQKTAYGQDSPYIRGFTGFHTLLTVDGIRINNSVFRSGPNQYWSMVDLLSIERMQVLKGPFAVEFGSDAVGGVVRLFTPEESPPGPHPGSTSKAMLRLASAESSVSGRLETAFTGDGHALFSGITYRDFGDLEGGGPTGTQKGTGYREAAADLKWIRTLGKGRLVLCARGFRQYEVPRTHSTVDGLSWKGTEPGSLRQRDLDQERSLVYLRYSSKADTPWLESFEVTLSWQTLNEVEERVQVSSAIDRRGFNVDTTALIFRASAWDKSLFQFEYGLEGYRDFVDSFRIRSNPFTGERRVGIQGPVADNAMYDLGGLYVKGFWQATPSLMCTLGTRFTYARASADRFQDPLSGQVSRFSGNWSNLSTGLRAIWRPLRRLRLSGGISQGFRAPNLSDLTRLDVARSGELEIPSPHIGPESFWTAELGTSLEKGPLLLHLALYHTEIRDMIVRTPTGRLVQEGASTFFEVAKTNAGHGWVRGLEVSASMRLSNAWLLTGNVSWLDSQLERFSDTSSQPLRIREPLSRMMPPTANLSLRYTHPDHKWSCEGLFKAVRRQDDLAESDRRDRQRIPPGGTPGYAVVDLVFNWPFNPDVSLSIRAENLLDTAYRVHGSGVNAPGRNIIFSCSLRY